MYAYGEFARHHYSSMWWWSRIDVRRVGNLRLVKEEVAAATLFCKDISLRSSFLFGCDAVFVSNTELVVVQ